MHRISVCCFALFGLTACGTDAPSSARERGDSGPSAGGAVPSAGGGGSTVTTGGAPGAGGRATTGTGGGGTTSGAGGSAGSGAGGAGGGTELGTWQDVTPRGVSIDPAFNPATNFGVMDVVADPVRPSDVYAFVCYQGVWKSTDYGATWSKVSEPGSVLESGRPWTAAIDNDRARDPSSPPTLYTANGYGSALGVFRSSNGGVTWTQLFAGNDIYSLEMDPYDDRHLITGMHEGPGIAETTDGGVTWTKIDTGGIGRSIYPHFIDTGAAATTRSTWFAIPQVDSGTGAAMTTDRGATFTNVGNFGHGHGGNQLFNAGGGTAYVGAQGGVWRTVDAGAHWATIDGSTDHGYQNGVVGTAAWLYTWDDGANASGIGGAYLLEAPRKPGTAWTAMTAPPAMNNGGKTVAVTYDGAHYILVSGSWNAGIWRYVEP